MKKELINVALLTGYTKKDYGYKRVTKNNTHRITIFSDGSFRMYAYFNEDPEMDKVYDTGIIKTSAERLALLIGIFIKSHK